MDCYVNRPSGRGKTCAFRTVSRTKISFFEISFCNFVLLIFLNRNYSKLIMKLAILFEINNEKNEEEIEAKE